MYIRIKHFMVFIIITAIIMINAGCRKQQPPTDTDTAPQKETSSVAASEKPQAVEEQQDTIVKDSASIWLTDFNLAKATAVKENKDMLLNFSGSDWCGWCIKLDKEAFSREPFISEAPKLFVPVILDIPRDKSKQTPELIAQNKKLSSEYEIMGFPTVLLTDAQGMPYAQTGYQPGGPEKYMEHLNQLRQAKVKVNELLAQSEKTELSPLEKAKLIDEALDILGEDITARYYNEQISRILTLDSEDKAGLKTKYSLRLKLSELDKSLQSKQYSRALEICDSALKEYSLQGEAAQELYYAKAHAQHFLKDAQGEHASLQAALQAAPEGPYAEQIKGQIQQTLMDKPVSVVRPAKFQTTLKTYLNYRPERAFDGDESDSYFWSDGGPKAGDVFDVILDESAEFNTVKVYTGSVDHPQDYLYKGAIEVSADGEKFTQLGTFTDGTAEVANNVKPIKVVRLRVLEDQTNWLVIREIQLTQ